MNRRDVLKWSLAAPVAALAAPEAAGLVFPDRAVIPAKPAAFCNGDGLRAEFVGNHDPRIWRPTYDEIVAWSFMYWSYYDPAIDVPPPAGMVRLYPKNRVTFSGVDLREYWPSAGNVIHLPKAWPSLTLDRGDVLVIDWEIPDGVVTSMSMKRLVVDWEIPDGVVTSISR